MVIPETTQGVFPDMSDAEYHAHKGHLSASTMKKFLEVTPEEAVADLHTTAQKDYFDTGSAFHCLLLRPDAFASEFIISPAVDRRTKAGKATWQAHEAQAAATGAIALTGKQHEEVQAMVRAVREHPRWGGIAASFEQIETAYFAEVETDAGSVWGRAKPDATGAIGFDAKSTSGSLTEYGVTKAAADFGWPVQAAWYSKVMRACGVAPPPRWVFGVVTKGSRPMARFIELDPADIEAAEAAIPFAVERWIDGLETGHWPGHEEIDTLPMPAWWRNRMAALAGDPVVAEAML